MKKVLSLGHWNWIICSLLDTFCSKISHFEHNQRREAAEAENWKRDSSIRGPEFGKFKLDSLQLLRFIKFQNVPLLTHPLLSFTFEEFLSFFFCPLLYKEMVKYGRLGEKVEKFWNKISLTPCCHSLLKSSFFSFYASCSIKKWLNMGGWEKRWNIFGTK